MSSSLPQTSRFGWMALPRIQLPVRKESGRTPTSAVTRLAPALPQSRSHSPARKAERPVVAPKPLDIDLSDLFEPYPAAPCPAQIDPQVWESIFPPDRQAVRRQAGRYVTHGFTPDKAVEKAIAWVTARALKPKSEAKGSPEETSYPELEQALGPHATSEAQRLACQAVRDTAAHDWPAILAAPSRVRAAFRHRVWGTVTPTACLMCGHAAVDEVAKWPLLDGGRQRIHEPCLPHMKVVGPAFGKAVLAEAMGHAQRHYLATGEDLTGLDPDEPASWERD